MLARLHGVSRVELTRDGDITPPLGGEMSSSMLGSRLGYLARRQREEGLTSLGLQPLEALEPLGSEHLFEAESNVRGFTLHPLKFDLESVDAFADVVRLLRLVSGAADISCEPPVSLSVCFLLEETVGAEGTSEESQEPGRERAWCGTYARGSSRLDSGGIDAITRPSHGSVGTGGVGGRLANIARDPVDPGAVRDEEEG
jgi:hypothetical protein